MVVDCHQKQAVRNEMEARAASTLIASNRKLVHTTLSQWDQLYNAANRTYGEFEGATGGQPVLTNWAVRYLLFDKKRYNAAALTIEGDDNLAGSVHLQSCTRRQSSCTAVSCTLPCWNGCLLVRPRWSAHHAHHHGRNLRNL